MTNIFRSSAITLAVISPALLSACGPAPENPVAATTPGTVVAVHALPPHPKPRVFTLDTPVKRIAADPEGKAILNRDVPGLMANKNYPLFDDMSLSEIAMMSHGRLTATRLALVKSDLNQLPTEPAAN